MYYRWLLAFWVCVLAFIVSYTSCDVTSPEPYVVRSYSVRLTAYEFFCYEGDTVRAVRDSGQFVLTLSEVVVIADTSYGLAQGSGALWVETRLGTQTYFTPWLLGPMYGNYVQVGDTLALLHTEPQTYLHELPWRIFPDSLVLHVFVNAGGYLVDRLTTPYCAELRYTARRRGR